MEQTYFYMESIELKMSLFLYLRCFYW